jgi:murein DD-endopeptidase
LNWTIDVARFDRRRFLMAVGSTGALAAVPGAAGFLRESFDIVVPVVPSPVAMHGADHLVYELHLTNFSADRLSVSRLQVKRQESGAVLAEFAARALEARMAHVRPPADQDIVVAPGRRAVVYVELAVPSGTASGRLFHRLEYAVDGAAQVFATEGAAFAIGAPAVVIGPPLAGGPWVAVHSADWPRGHRRVVYTIDGRARIPGRFAIDWVKVNSQGGKVARGDPDVPTNHLGYGADVIAVADATVAAVRDDMTEMPTVSGNRRHPLADASGNFVALALGVGHFAFYEHLKPGSVRVRAGDAVKRGKVLAALGFTGDSTGPHLHFHVADAPSPLGGEGMPFVIDRFELLGRYDDVAMLGSVRWSERPDTIAPERLKERPGPNDVVSFQEAVPSSR